MSDCICSAAVFREKVLLRGTRTTEFPSLTIIRLQVRESSHLTLIPFPTIGITCLYHGFLPSGTTSKGALLDTQAYLNYIVSHAAKKPKPVLEPVKPPQAIIFPEQNRSKYHGTALRQHQLVLTLLFAQTNTKELCVLTRWYARFVQNTAHLHTIKTDKK